MLSINWTIRYNTFLDAVDAGMHISENYNYKMLRHNQDVQKIKGFPDNVLSSFILDQLLFNKWQLSLIKIQNNQDVYNLFHFFL